MEDQLKIQSADALMLELPIAGIGSRSYAFIIDWHIRLILALGWFFLIMIISALLAGGEEGVFFNPLWRNIAAWPSLIVYFFYHPVLEYFMQGRTPGKRMAGVRIVTTDGRVPGLGAIIVRNVFRLVDSLPSFYLVGIITCGIAKQQTRFGDMAAGTLLIHEKRATERDLDNMLELTRHDAISAEQYELVQTLRLRWSELTQAARIRLAEHLLLKLQQPLPEPRANPLYREHDLRVLLDKISQGVMA
jgi:uncharacterized RDD family membrane protein YckC